MRRRPAFSVHQIKSLFLLLPPSLANYLRLLELKLSRDGADNREALRHYREVSWVFLCGLSLGVDGGSEL